MFLLLAGQQMILFRRMRLLESVLVTMFEREVPILLVPRSLLQEIVLSHYVQLSWRRQPCVARRLLSGFFSDPICLSFLRCSAVSRTTRVERGHTAHEKRDHRHHHKKPNWFEFSRHGCTQRASTINVNLCVLRGIPLVCSMVRLFFRCFRLDGRRGLRLQLTLIAI